MTHSHDVVVVGAGLAGLVATAELTAAGHHVTLLDAEPAASLGGQAFWSFGGLFLVDSPEQRRLRIRDSAELALADWFGSADFADDGSDRWGRAWAEGFVDFAAGDMRPWLHGQGVRWFPLVQWPERGGYLADGHGNSVPALPRHVGHRARACSSRSCARCSTRAPPGSSTSASGTGSPRWSRPTAASRACAATCWRPTTWRAPSARHARSSRPSSSTRRPSCSPPAGSGRTTSSSGRCGPRRPDACPTRMLSGVPDHVDGSGIEAARSRGRRRRARGPDVALPRGGHRPHPGVVAARHPHPARSVLAVARRRRPPPARPAVPRLRLAGRAAAHHRVAATTTRGSSSTRPSSARSSRCPAPSRTPT